MATIKSVSALIVDGDWIESKDQSPEGIRLIQTGNIGIGTYLDKPNRAKYISEETFERLNCTELNIGDILVSRLPDPIGRACRVPNNIGRAITAVDCTIIRLNPDKCDAEYFVQYTQSELYQNRLSQFFAGSTRTRISRKNLEQIEIPLPNIAEQRHIVSTLGKVDELIALRKEQLAKLDQLVKSRFIELFGDPVKNTMGWPSKPLNDVCDGIGDGLHGTPEYDDNGGYPFINGNNLIDGKIVITSATKMVSQETYTKHFIDISSNAILISINGTLGKLAFYNGEQVMLGKSACYCNLKLNVNKVFVYGVMKSDAFAEFLDNCSTKSTIKNVGLKAMREYKLILPPTELQEQFAAFVEQTDKSKLAIQQSLDKLETLKKTLMQEYFG